MHFNGLLTNVDGITGPPDKLSIGQKKKQTSTVAF
jgi:hypothetical protein